MRENISIEEINKIEAKRICKETKFSKLRPVACYKCGNKENFSRRLFKIKGVPKNRQSDDEIQNLLAHHFRQNYLIEFIFFKTLGNKFIIDSAICDICKSTAITYDIEITPDLLSEVAKYTEKDGAK